MPIKIAVVDDQLLFRQGLIALLKEYKELDVIIEAENGKELLIKIEEQKPDVVLLDLEMPVMCGIETTEYLHKHYPEIKILVLSLHNDESIIRGAIERGAHEFLLKDFSIEVITKVVQAVKKPDYCPNGSISKGVLDDLTKVMTIKPLVNPDNLSKRELEIIKCLALELTSREISEKLFISQKTVGNHRENIQKKIGAVNTAGIILYAMRNNLI